MMMRMNATNTYKNIEFPAISGYNLLKERYDLPGALEGEQNLLFTPFQQWQQTNVDSWLPMAEELERSFPWLRYYELPVIRSLNFLAQTFINSGMRAGIPRDDTRRRTITLYIDKVAFRRALKIESENQLHILLVNRQGKIFWRERGIYSLEKAETLLDILTKFSHTRTVDMAGLSVLNGQTSQ